MIAGDVATALAMEAAIELRGKIKKLAMYEAPYNDDDARQAWKQFRKQLQEVLAADRRGHAVALFMMLLGVPADQIEGMREDPMWPMWEAVAPTIAYDAAVLGEDASILLIHPLVLGSGRRLFPDGSSFAALRLVDVKTTPTGVVIATYSPLPRDRKG